MHYIAISNKFHHLITGQKLKILFEKINGFIKFQRQFSFVFEYIRYRE